MSDAGNPSTQEILAHDTGFVSFCCSDKDQNQKQLGEKRVYLAYISHVTLSEDGTQGKSLEAGTRAEAMEQRCLLARLLWLTELACLHTQNLGLALPTVTWASPHQSSFKNSPPACTQANLISVFSTQVPSS